MRTRNRLLPALLVAASLAACRSGKRGSVDGGHGGLELPPARTEAPREFAFDVESYALDLEILPEARAIRGTCTLRVFPRTAPIRSVELDLDDLDVTGVKDDRGRPLAFERRPGTLRVDLGSSVEIGDCAEIVVAYGGSPRKGLYFAAIREGAPTQVFTQGECEDARGWFPCCDAPSERARSEIRVTMPVRWTSVAAGERIERTEDGGQATELWRMSAAHPAYLTTLVAGELETRASIAEGIPLLDLAAPALAPRLEPNLAETGAILAVFAGLTGRSYPYAKYAQACVDDFCFGGMENVSATTLTDTCLLDERGRRDSPQTGLVAHEAAHQWFGDLLTCRDWSHVWLNEGFATYCASLYKERASGVDAFRAEMRDLQTAYVAADVGKNRRPIVYGVARRPMDLFFSGHAYGGAAVRLHLLRHLLGDEAFFRGIREYVAQNAGRAVATDDFRASMEAASGKDLAPFFADWLASPGFPEFESSWRYDEKRRLVILAVNQVQEIAGGTPAEFRTPVEIGIRDASGQRTVRISIERRRQLFEIATPEKPVFVRFDEHSWIPKRLEERKPLEEWIAIAGLDEDVDGRRDAVAVLGRVLSKSPSGATPAAPLPALVERVGKDTSAVVRAEACAALSGIRDPSARKALADAAEKDPEAKVRAAALDALCALGPDPDLAELARRAYEEAFSWNTAASAAALLGSAEPQGFGEWLHREIEDPKTADVLRSRLLPLLGRARDPKAFETLVRWAGNEGAAEDVRSTAGRELGSVGRGKPEARKLLESLLASPRFRVRRAAADALGALRDPGALDALRAAHARTALVPELRAIEAACESLAAVGAGG